MVSPFLSIGLYALLAFTIAVTIWITYHGIMSKLLAKNVHPLSRKLANPKKKILLIGDSTARGVGAKNIANSISGRLIAAHDDVSIISDGVLGGKIVHMQSLFQSHATDGPFDLVIVICGGMDVVQFTSPKQYRKALEELIVNIKLNAKKVIYVSAPNVGNTPIFPFPVSAIYTNYAKLLRKIAKNVSENHEIIHVDLFREKDQDLFSNSKNFFAKDMTHPNDEGYALWFSEIEKAVSVNLD